MRKHPEKRIANIVQAKDTRFQAKELAEPEEIFHWRKDGFVALKGQSTILLDTLRETLRLRKALPEREEKTLKEFGNTLHAVV